MPNTFDLLLTVRSQPFQTRNPIQIFHLTFRLALQEPSNLAPLLPHFSPILSASLRCVSYFFSIVFSQYLASFFLLSVVVFVYAVKVQNVNNQNANARWQVGGEWE